MRWLLLPSGFIVGALIGFMAEIGIASLVERWRGTRIEVPILIVPLLPAALGVVGAFLLLDVVRRVCGPAPSALAILNAIATVFLIGLALFAALALVANPFDESGPGDTLYYILMLGPLAAMLVTWGALRRGRRP